MGYRQIYIKKASKLSFKDNQLVVFKDLEENKIPLEDINYILLEDATTILTSRLLAEIGKKAISLIICDEKHIPTSIMYPYNFHYKQLENMELQINNTPQMKDELWKLIITSKISNQISLLERKIEDENTINKLKQFLKEIQPGDTTNREGLSAKMYFRSLFGSEFIRHYDDGINAALNYGYSILLSCFVRNLSIYGLLTFYGINHQSVSNNFNLACDLMEPFRPIVDEYVYDNIDNITNDLNSEIRKNLVNIVNKEVYISNKKCSIEYAIEILVQSLIRSFNTGELYLELPKLIYD